MDVYTAIRGRRSITGLTEDAPSREAIDRIIQASVWAPNHHLTEPWRFHVLRGAARDAMGAMVADRLESELDPNDPASAPSIRSARVRLRRSPVVIVVSQVWSDDPVTNLEDYASVCCATQNLMLAAHMLKVSPPSGEPARCATLRPARTSWAWTGRTASSGTSISDIRRPRLGQIGVRGSRRRSSGLDGTTMPDGARPLLGRPTHAPR